MVKAIPNGVLSSTISSPAPRGYACAVWPSAVALWDDWFDHPAYFIAGPLRFSPPIRMALAQRRLLI
jgi:hypothetical protein